MARQKTRALVTDGVRARILRGSEGDAPAETIDLAGKAESIHLREILSDRAGRSFASAASGRRSAMEPGSGPVMRDMQDVAQETLATLEDHRRAEARPGWRSARPRKSWGSCVGRCPPPSARR